MDTPVNVTDTPESRESPELSETAAPVRSRLVLILLAEGKEPDPRFTLANERTFLAWTRTSLALLAGGIALEAFPLPALHPTVQSSIALLVISIGMIIALGAAVRWLRVERAMRRVEPLPLPAIVPFLAGVVTLACALTIWSLL